MKIGFIGLGIMGKPMARNLLKAGHELFVFDSKQESINQLIEDGAIGVASSKEAAEQSEVLITMVQNSPQVKKAVLGQNGILEGAKPGTILIDMSSIAPLASQEICRACEEKGVNMLDAPVSGGEIGAINGTLSIMVGGKEEIFNQVKEEILLKVGKSAILCGDIGAGNTTKLANQVIVAANIAAVAEAFTLATKAGVDPQKVFDAIKGGLAGSQVMIDKAPNMLKGDYQPGFRVDLHIKDLLNALETGHEIGAPLPITSQVMEMMQNLKADGFATEDHSALARFYEKLSGQAISK